MGRKQHAFVYVETDLPEGVTLTDWRRAKAQREARSGLATPPREAPQVSVASHRYLRPTVQEIRRHGEPFVPQRRAA